jgi:hypothetical protein
MPEQGRAEYSVINAVWLTLLVVLSAIVVGALRRGEEVLADMHITVDAASVETLAQEEERRRIVHEVASALHGTLQGRLVSLPDPDTAGDAVRETLALLQAGGAITSPTRVRDAAASALEPWDSLLEFTIECSDEVVPSSVAQAIVDVLEECVSNAFRHGHARHVHCRIAAIGAAVEVTVIDDGRGGVAGEELPGLGSRILDRCGTWSRTYGAAGTTVSIVIPA